MIQKQADLYQFWVEKIPKTSNTELIFLNGKNKWIYLTKKGGGFYAVKTLRDTFRGLGAMKGILGLEAPAGLDRSIKVVEKLNSEIDFQMNDIPMERLPKKAKEIQDKIREATATETDLDMRKFLALDKALQSIKGELILNVSKLTKIDKNIERETKKLEEVENYPSYSDEQRQLYRERLGDLNIEKKGRLEIISQHRKEFQKQVARIKQISISTIVLAIIGVLRGDGTGGSASTPKHEGGVLKKWLDWLANALKGLARKAVEALPVIIGSVVGAILSFLSEAVRFVAKQTWVLIVAVAGLIGMWLMQRINRKD